MSGLCWVLLGLLALTLVLHLAAWLFHVSVAARVFGQLPWLPAERPGPASEGESVELTTRDGVRLVGTYLPTTGFRRRGVVLFCHELNADRWSALFHAGPLRALGFDLFTFDFRNHGASQRLAHHEPTAWVTAGEVLDAAAALDYLAARPDADPRGIGLMGVSRGAAVALCAAAQDGRVRALVLDALVPTEQIQIDRARRWLARWGFPTGLLGLLPDGLLGLFGRWTKYLAGRRGHGQAVDLDQAAAQVQQPVLMIHGSQDRYVSAAAINGLRAKLAGRSRLWEVPGAVHGRTLAAVPEQYPLRVARHFVRHLGRPLDVDAAHPKSVRRPKSKRQPRMAGGVRSPRLPGRHEGLPHLERAD